MDTPAHTLRSLTSSHRWSGWRAAALAVACLAAVPLLVLLFAVAHPEPGIWSHLADNVLPGLFLNTFKLVFGVGAGTLILGVGLAWLTVFHDFPGRRIFSWALVLPMAVPGYVLAFVFLGLFSFTGPVQGLLRQFFPGIGFIDIRTGTGVAAVLSLTLYPYVYLMARSAFLTQGRTAVEAARTMGMTPGRAFFKVVLPMARPWIATGLMLVIMETLADFGAVSIFNYDTFTTAIYKAWFGLFSLHTAAQLSALLVVVVLAVLWIERTTRSRMRHTQAGRTTRTPRVRLAGPKAWLATLACLSVFCIAFGLPLLRLAQWSLASYDLELGQRYLSYTLRTLSLGLAAALLTTLCSTILTVSERRHPGPLSRFTSRTATLGYALPGTVLAVGVFIPAIWLDVQLGGILSRLFGQTPGQIVQGSVGLMVVAYAVRFMAAGFAPISSAMARMSPSVDDAARVQGVTGVSLLRRVYLPMLRKGCYTALLIVGVDVMKEMPLTLMTRPFGWDTLAVKIYELTSEGEWERAALPALTLVCIGLLPVALLTARTEQ